MSFLYQVQRMQGNQLSVHEANAAEEKMNNLIAYLRDLGHVAVAFSAGVDSSFLLKTAQEALGSQVIAITGRFASSPKREDQEAVSLCHAWGIEQMVVDIDQISIPGFADNPPDRCYLCKKALFTSFLAIARERGFLHLAEGSNADDVSDYRPGLRAIAELGVKSPLKDVGLTKQEIRYLSEKMGLPTWNKPALACLATRLPYGERITQEKLNAIDEAEQMLVDCGFSHVRVRMHGDLARIEVSPSQFVKILDPNVLQPVRQKLYALGFLYVTLDLDGYKTGSMNKTLEYQG